MRSGSLLIAGALVLSGCAGASPTAPGTVEGGASAAPSAPGRTEVGTLTPRIVLAHERGVTVIDSTHGEVLAEVDLAGYVRLGPAGDGRHVALAAGDGFSMLDTGLIARTHGDHSHYFTQAPALTDLSVAAPEPGHVVAHGGRTALFADGTGEIILFEPDALGEGSLGATRTLTSAAAHHGVAVPLSDGSVLRTEGTGDERRTVVVEDASGAEIARTDACPGVHGEAVAQANAHGDVVAIGCTDGPVVYRDGAFHKYPPIPGHERSGNLAGVGSSSVVLLDGEPVTEHGDARGSSIIGLLDTAADGSIMTVDLGSPYWFRSLGRGPLGEALVLTEDGELNIIDPVTGELRHEVKAVEPWTEPADWQQAAPMLAVAGSTAFVVDPQHRKLMMIDIESGQALRTLGLPVVPHEIQVTTGTP